MSDEMQCDKSTCAYCYEMNRDKDRPEAQFIPPSERFKIRRAKLKEEEIFKILNNHQKSA